MQGKALIGAQKGLGMGPERAKIGVVGRGALWITPSVLIVLFQTCVPFTDNAKGADLAMRAASCEMRNKRVSQ